MSELVNTRELTPGMQIVLVDGAVAEVVSNPLDGVDEKRRVGQSLTRCTLAPQVRVLNRYVLKAPPSRAPAGSSAAPASFRPFSFESSHSRRFPGYRWCPGPYL